MTPSPVAWRWDEAWDEVPRAVEYLGDGSVDGGVCLLPTSRSHARLSWLATTDLALSIERSSNTETRDSCSGRDR